MEPSLEALAQQVEWLDQERRKDRTAVVALQERFTALEGELRAMREEMKQLSDEITRLNTLLAKSDRLESRLAEHEAQAAAAREALAERFAARLDQAVAPFSEELESLRSWVQTFDRRLKEMAPLKGAIQTVEEALEELRRRVAEVDQRAKEVVDVREEFQRTTRLLQEAQDRAGRRLNDLQGELSALRKRLEERSAQWQLLAEGLQKVESRVNELAAAEMERVREQREFIETQARQQIERERLWKQWEQRFAELEDLSQQVAGYLETWSETLRNLRGAEQRFEEMTERLERRIHEITEMQRLAEDRFRQEWNAFKADDQKRWANYVLSQEERGRDLDRRLEQLREDLGHLQEQMQGMEDLLQTGDEQTRKRLQALLALAQEWLSEYERALGMMRSS